MVMARTRAFAVLGEELLSDPAHCPHCGHPSATVSLSYCHGHRAEQRERSRRAFEDRQRRRRR